MFRSFSLFPLNYIFSIGGLVLLLAVIAFWVWMIIDCSKRNFRSNLEKVIWILVIIFGQTLGALAYLIVVMLINKRGILSK